MDGQRWHERCPKWREARQDPIELLNSRMFPTMLSEDVVPDKHLDLIRDSIHLLFHDQYTCLDSMRRWLNFFPVVYNGKKSPYLHPCHGADYAFAPLRLLS